jgi:hypothetical protein
MWLFRDLSREKKTQIQHFSFIIILKIIIIDVINSVYVLLQLYFPFLFIDSRLTFYRVILNFLLPQPIIHIILISNFENNYN